MKRLTLLFVFGAVAVGLLLTAALAEDAKKPASLDGKTLFLDQKCESCHSISSMKIMKKVATAPAGKDAKVPPDLSTVGDKVKADFLMNYLKKMADLDGAKHMKKFKGNDDSLKVLVDWLMSLKAPEKAGTSK